MQVKIKVISVENTYVPTAKGGYNKLEVAYKNIDSGKVESKVLMSFGLTENSYKALADAKSNDQFVVESEKKPGKDGKEYWTWLSASQQAPGTVMEPQVKTAGTPVPKSNYETPEERAKKQVYIVKQSSLGSAIELLSIGAKTPPTKQDVLALAQEFTDWVFATQEAKQLGLADMPDDFPDVQ
jgi:hypothetical protein